jgi:hypothetical protein
MKRSHALLLLACAFISGCASKPKTSKVQYIDDAPPEFKEVGGEASANDIALFLAGKPVKRGATLSRLQLTADYQLHQREMRTVWNRLSSRRIAAMNSWSGRNLPSPSVVHYPFGGPDLLHVRGMFPNTPNYVLLGLEGVGEVPPLEHLPAEEVLGALPAYREATKTQLRVGYFITKDMRSDLERSALRGVTPILLGTIALSNGSVTGVSSISAGGKPGIEVTFEDSRGENHRATYVSGDLSNSGFNGAYQSWVAAQGRGVTYFKAASYLTHDDRFSKVRNFYLANSNAILQDDSGIPFRYFDQNQWEIRYFGNYEAPIELFSKHAQSDLRAAYAANPKTSIPFGSGYHFEAWDANLILATKR